MKVSIIVPLFNKEAYVDRCLDSVAAQTLTEFEVIVVDDGSTDGGGERVARYSDRRFRLIRQPNGGPGAARNRGIAEARGELLAFLDADDAWLPQYLETAVRMLESYGLEVAAVTSGYIDYPRGSSRERFWKARGIVGGVQRVTPDTSASRLVQMLAYMSPCTTVVRADVVRRWGGFYAENGCRYAEDAMLWLKVLLNERVCFDPRPLAEFHREASELSGNYRRARPVEPFLLNPDEIKRSCPGHLCGLLRCFLSIRACKSAAVLGYWGQHEEARELLRRFVSLRQWRMPFYPFALVGCTPLGGLLGRAWRGISSYAFPVWLAALRGQREV